MPMCVLCLGDAPDTQFLDIEECATVSGSCMDMILAYFTFAERIAETRKITDKICVSCWTRLEAFHDFHTLIGISYGVIEEVELKHSVIFEDIIEEESKDVEADDDGDEEDEYEMVHVEALDECALEAEDVIVAEEVEFDVENNYKSRRSAAPPIDPEDDLKIRQTANMFCDICQHPLESFSHARTHFRSEHGTVGYLVCCDKRYKQRNRLIDHLNTHFNVQYPCPVCSKTFDAKAYLTRHMAHHESVKLFECDHCPKTFAKKYLVRNHLLGVHRYENVAPSYACPYEGCGKLFVNESRLKHHLKYTHSRVDQEACEICAKTFKTKSAIEEHMRIHYRRPEDRFKCDICGHYIADLKSFKRHVKNHETEGLDNTCHYCGKKSPNLNALKKHITFVHEKEKSYQCRYCEKSFKRPRNLIDHEASVHTLQELYKCTFCPKTFRNQSNMLAHRKKKHPDQYQKPAYMRDVV